MKYQLASRMAGMKASAVREILKVTQRPEVISFAGGLPAPELFLSMKSVRLPRKSAPKKAAKFSSTQRPKADPPCDKRLLTA